MPVALYGCKTCSLALRENRGDPNRMMGRIFDVKKDELTRRWEKIT
jgi:hypothetical protein